MAIKIRLMTKKDLPAVLKLTKKAFNSTDAKTAWSDILLHFKCDEAGIYDGKTFWVAEEGGVVGIVGIERRITANQKKQGWLEWYAVLEEHRGKGIGRSLFLHALKEAKKRGIGLFCIDEGTFLEFKRANGMYKRHGFKPKFAIKNYWQNGDNLVVVCRRL